MARKTISGLTKIGGIWHIDKLVDGKRVCRSTGTSDRRDAEQFLIQLIESLRRERCAPKRYTVRDAMIRYLREFKEQRSIKLTAYCFKTWEPLIGSMYLEQVCDETLAAHKSALLMSGLSNRTINIGLQRIGRLLSLSARKWRTEDGMAPWLTQAPAALTILPENTERAAPLSWIEQRFLLAELSTKSAAIAEFLANTGCREQEALKLKWEWMIQLYGMDRPVFVIPAEFGGRTGTGGVKNGVDRVIVLNVVAARIIENRKNIDAIYVFGDGDNKPPYQLNGKGWRAARERAANRFQSETGSAAAVLPSVRVHDLKHTFGARLRAAGVAFVDRQELLGHKPRNVTDHYSSADLLRLQNAADMVMNADRNGPSLVEIKRKAG